MEKNSDEIIILAAGNGSRLKSDIPKVFHKIGDMAALDHIIKTSIKMRPQKIIVVLQPKFQNFETKYLKPNVDSLEIEGVQIRKVFQKTPQGTGDAVKYAFSEIDKEDGFVYVLYGDTPLVSAQTLQKLKKAACPKTAIAVLSMKVLEHSNLGRLIADDDAEFQEDFFGTKIKGIIEAKDLEKNPNVKTLPLCNTGLLFRKKFFKYLIKKIKNNPITNEFYITDVVKIAHEEGHIIRCIEGDSKELFGLNTREDLSILEKNFQNRERQKHLKNGVTLISPETVFFSSETEIENDVIINPYVVFLGHVKIKKGTEIKPFSVIEGSDISKSIIGPFARIRPNSIIKENAKIGNFVEIKNSQIFENARVNHLSYIGDAEVGEKTNIGAGTITCNYDGFKKHHTKIGSNVFIGSNSAIIAPIEIDNDALIAAGSVITKNVEENSLAISRSPQKNIENGSKVFKKKRG